jgi:GNAT superfamily N-acetyltransferase
MMADSALTIRPARSDDRPAMEQLCAHTWQWGDYIPEVWDEWLADEQGGLIVGQLAGQVVALSKITFQATGQVWLEGMRVDPNYRGQGIAGRFLDYSLDYARRRGARVVRLGTSGSNRPVHVIAARTGMQQVGAYVLRQAGPLPGGSEPAILGPGDAGRVRAFLQGSPVLAQASGLYSQGWAWQELSTGLVAEFLAQGQVAAHLAPDGDLAALATLHFGPQDGQMWVGFVDGPPPAVAALAAAIRAHAARLAAEKVRIMLPAVDWLRDTFCAAEYEPGDWEGELWIFERHLGPQAEAGHGR